MKKELVSLIIPCYNEEEVLGETSKRLLEKINKMIDNNQLCSLILDYSVILSHYLFLLVEIQYSPVSINTEKNIQNQLKN